MAMSNVIRLNEHAPTQNWLSMSNQGTDLFLELLILAGESVEKTPSQKNLLSFLSVQRDINNIAPGTAGFDIEEMPWNESSLFEDANFLIEVAEIAKQPNTWKKVGFKPDEVIISSWLNLFEKMIKEMKETV